MSHFLSMDQGQNLKQAQRLMMMPQMQQALQLLQAPVMELSALIEAELENNPLLEKIEPDTESEIEIEEEGNILLQIDHDAYNNYYEFSGATVKKIEERDFFLENCTVAKEGRFSFLLSQVLEHFSSAKQVQIATSIVGNLDQLGFLDTPLSEIAALEGCFVEEVEEILSIVQKFEPAGIAARNIRESLLIQLQRKGKEKTLAYQIIYQYYIEMLHNKIPMIASALGLKSAVVQRVINEEIASLQLQPGNIKTESAKQWIAVDFHIVEEAGELKIAMSDEGIPCLGLRKSYVVLLQDPTVSLETKDYIKNKITSSKWLMKNIFQRNDTLYRIAEQLIEHQKEFFLHKKGNLSPLTMKKVAEAIGVHESTVVRAVSHKYLSCPKGVFLLKNFFTNTLFSSQGEGISSSTVKEALLKILHEEDREKPFSDTALSSILKKEGMLCARRTVAKYRTEFGIGNASQRKIWKEKK